MPLQGFRQIINIPPGVNKDDNAFTSLSYSDADKIRFHQGLPEKIGGWIAQNSINDQELKGVPRTIYTYDDFDGIERTIIGTHTRLYSYQNGYLYNITPLVTGTTAIPNSLATNFTTFATDAIAVIDESDVATITYSPLTTITFQEQDLIQIAGVASAIGGVPAASFNDEFSIFNVTATTFDIYVGTAATSTATGGTGATLSTKIITVTQAAHGFANGDRIKIASAANFGGYLAGDLNIEGIIRYVNANSYKYALITTSYATSSATAGGGAATTVQGQIAAGECTIRGEAGFGAGPYGLGAYSEGANITGSVTLPRIWSIDRYNDGVVLTPGSQGALYEWDGDVNVAPTIVLNSPTAINYVFVASAENQIVTFGDGNPNQVHTSDVGDATVWTANSSNVVFNRRIDGAGTLIGHAYVRGQYLLFTVDAVYKMVFVGKPDIWVVQKVTDVDGLIGPWAVIDAADVVVWMGQNDFYIYDGSTLVPIPNNTLIHWLYDRLNTPKAYVSFAWYLENFDEIWWFFPSNGSDEPDNYIIWNYKEGHFTNGTLARTAAERNVNSQRLEYLAYGACDDVTESVLYQHEIFFSDNEAPMVGSLTSNYALIGEGDYIQNISQITPSNLLLPIGSSSQGELLYSLTINTKDYDQDTNTRSFGPYDVYSNTSKIDCRILGRQRQYSYSFANTVGFRIQKTYETNKPFTVR